MIKKFKSVTSHALDTLSPLCHKLSHLLGLPPTYFMDGPFQHFSSNIKMIDSQKLALVFPTLKKPNLDPDLCQHYHPISNPSFLSKTLERLVSLQLLPYIEQSGLLSPSQSGFRARHSTETVLLSLLSDIYSAVNRSQLTLLALYDVSAAFDMVNHYILLQSLEPSCGIRGNPLLWLKSYLSGRTQMVICGDTRTPWVLIKSGVPQGSVLGPLIYLLSIYSRHS